ncbi:MAG: IPT/TIG domain-containing protein [bacterium]
MIIKKYRMWLIPFICFIFIALCPNTYARHFDLTLVRPARTPPYLYYMITEGSLTINGKAQDLDDEVGFFVQVDDGSWKLCGVTFPTGSGTGYTGRIFSYLCVDIDPDDGVDKVPIDESRLQVRFFDGSTGTEQILNTDNFDNMSSSIKNTQGNFIYMTNDLISGTSQSDPWRMDIIIGSAISVTDVTPALIYNDAQNTLTITGEQFETGMSVKLGTQSLGSVTFIDINHISAVVPKDFSQGIFNLTVRTSDGREDILYNAVEVKKTPACGISKVEERIYGGTYRYWWITTTCSVDESFEVVLTDAYHHEYNFGDDITYAENLIVAPLPSEATPLPAGTYWTLLKNPNGTTNEYPSVTISFADKPSITRIRDYGNNIWSIFTENTTQSTEVKLVNEKGEEVDFASVDKDYLPVIDVQLPDLATLPCGTYHTLLRNPGGLTGEYLQKTVQGPCIEGVSVRFAKGMNLFGFPIELESPLNSYDVMDHYFSPDELNCIQSYEIGDGEPQWEISYWNSYNRPAGTKFSIDIHKAYVLYMKKDMEIVFIGTPLNSMPTGELKEGLNLVNSSGAPAGYLASDLLNDLGDESGITGIAHFDVLDQTWKMVQWFFGNFEGTDFPLQDGRGHIIFIQ